jgi:hypothetical protein
MQQKAAAIAVITLSGRMHLTGSQHVQPAGCLP